MKTKNALNVDEQRTIKQLIVDSSIRRESDKEIKTRIDNYYRSIGLKKEIALRMITYYKTKIRQSAEAWREELMKSRFEYVAYYQEKANKMILLEKETWDIYKNSESEFIRLKCIETLKGLAENLTDLYDTVPFIGKLPDGQSNKSDAGSPIQKEIREPKFE